MCYEDTGHAEAVLVEFDPSVLSYAGLLERFWKMHDYTRRSPEGYQYRSVIFVRNVEQRRIVEESKAELERSHRSTRPVATRIEPAGIFWRAEDYHQRYYEKHRFSCR